MIEESNQPTTEPPPVETLPPAIDDSMNQAETPQAEALPSEDAENKPAAVAASGQQASSDMEVQEAEDDDSSRSEGYVVATILVGLLVVLLLHVVVGWWRGGDLELERLPEHQFDFRLDINTAGPIELIHLPGVGPTLADRIVEDRKQHGPFRSAFDLQRVHGIGPRLAEQIAPYVEFGPVVP